MFCTFSALTIEMFIQSIVLFSFIVIIIINIKSIFFICFNFKRDFGTLLAYILMKRQLKAYECRDLSVVRKFEETVEKNPNKICVIFEDQKWTFGQMNAFANRVSNAIQMFNIEKQQTIALYMNNRPEFIGIWLGLAKAGLITALINTHVKSDGLIHVLRQCQCRAVIFEDRLEENMTSIVQQMERDSSNALQYYFSFGATSGKSGAPFVSFNTLIEQSTDVEHSVTETGFSDTLFYMFTSGTTGLPKASIVPNCKYLLSSLNYRLFGLTVSDIIYICLPLYHGTGVMLSLSNCICNGNTAVLAEKFSVNSFWRECIENDCTCFVYIGEMCRYLLVGNAEEWHNKHKIRLMFGLGLRENIWKDFVQRFGIKNVCEFYGCTEGNAFSVNRANRVGACGFIPYYWGPVFKYIYPTRIIRIDDRTNEVIRDTNGLCVECKPGEEGEIVTKIIRSDPTKDFYGYSDGCETRKKIIDNVFALGDKGFRTFDRMKINYFGDLYFRDRTGDTFRWKGENVSTTEVESMIMKITNNLFDCIVFGVEIADSDGKAGMAVIAADVTEVDMSDLLARMQTNLPTYAIPVFIRFTTSIDITCSLRLSKTYYKQMSYQLIDNNHCIYFLDKSHNKYIELNETIVKQIHNSFIKI